MLCKTNKAFTLLFILFNLYTISCDAKAPQVQLFPHFSTPADTLDGFQVEDPDISKGEQVMFTALQGIVNKTKPSIFLLYSKREGAYWWPDKLGLNIKEYPVDKKWELIRKYKSRIKGVILYSVEKSNHYCNLATTVAGLKNALPVTSAEYEQLRLHKIQLPVIADLSALPYSTPEEIYRYLYDTYWKDCNKHTLISLSYNIPVFIRDIAVASGAAVVWLDPRKEKENEALRPFLKDMKAGEGVILGWWAEERSGVGLGTEYGIPTIAADFYANATVYAGMDHTLQAPAAPKKPPLENKIYITVYLSDGDNIQYCQHAMAKLWEDKKRGTMPVNWTVSPALVDLGPQLLNYYYKTATPNDFFASGPSGLGYALLYDAHNHKWYNTGGEAFDRYVQLTENYLKKSGIRVITLWDQINEAQMESFATYCPSLLGATQQDWQKQKGKIPAYVKQNKLAFLPNYPCYAGSTDVFVNMNRDTIASFDGTHPVFLTAQGVSWRMGPDSLAVLKEKLEKLSPGNIVFCRGDHFFELYYEANGIDSNQSLDLTKNEKLLRYVDPIIGAGFHGHVFVGTSTPYGMVQLGPNNIFKGWDWCSGYHYSDSIVIGFSHTHLSGTGGSDLGDVLIMPFTGQIRTDKGTQNDISKGYASYYTHDHEIARPEYYSLLLSSYNIKAELTSSDRVGFHRYTFPKGKENHVIIDLKEGINDKTTESYIRQIDDYTFEGYRFSKGWSTHKVFFTLKSNTPVKGFTVFDDSVKRARKELKSVAVKGVMSFGDNPKEVMFKMGLSSVSCANAAEHIRLEISGWDFENTVKANSEKWERELSKVDIETPNEAYKRVFYTAFYHTMIDPSLYCDYNGEFRVGINDSIYVANHWKNYSVLSLWDTYRTLHPLMTILQPEKVDDMINTILSIFDQQGKLPIWHLEGWETNLMPGCSAIPVVADAWLKGFKGFDGERAFHAVKTSATNPKQRQMPYILEKGYIPGDKVPEGTSLAMEYAVDDWGIAAMAKKMGKAEDFAYFSKRAQYYKTYFDKSINFIRPKNDDGSWKAPYDPAIAIHGLRGDFCEGNGWQYTFFVPQDPHGLIGLFGGDEVFAKKLDELFTTTTSMGPEASSDITGLIGQYAHGNEPSHHIAYLYVFAGQQWKTAEKVRFIMDQFYTDQPDGIIGNEDCGQMSAWYVMSSFGFYPVNPAGGIYAFGSPNFNKVTIHLPEGKKFVIDAINNSPENIYIQRVELNGKNYPKSYIAHKDIVNGGSLKYFMGNKPNKAFGALRQNRP